MSVDGAGIRVSSCVADLLADATHGVAVKNADSKSGCRMERVLVGHRPHIVKYLCVDDDWLMRASGDLGCRQRRLWRAPLVDRLPPSIDHTVVGIADYTSTTGRAGLALLMRDVGGRFVPEGDWPLCDEEHLRFLDHMAELHATFWGWHDDLDLFPFGSAYTVLTPVMATLEAERGVLAEVPAAVAAGWDRFRAAAPRAAGLVLSLLADPAPLVDGLGGTPWTLVHGDFKLGNLGANPDGRSILVDWDRAGEGRACSDLAWYLAVNCDRMALSKEAAIAGYRRSLEANGVRTESWWDAQLARALLGGLLMLGWAKVGGDPAEIGWWEERALDAARYLP